MSRARRKLLEQQIIFYESNAHLLTDKDKQELQKLKDELEQSKKGRSAKDKGSNYERKVAKLFKKYLSIDLKRTPQSGGFAKDSKKADAFRGDIITVDDSIDLKLHIECKNHKKWALKDWLKQAESDCPKGKIPCVVFHQNQNVKDGKVKDVAEDYITLKLEDFLELMAKDKTLIVHKRKKKRIIKKKSK